MIRTSYGGTVLNKESVVRISRYATSGFELKCRKSTNRYNANKNAHFQQAATELIQF